MPYGIYNAGEFKTKGAQTLAIQAALNNGVDPDLFQALVFHESAGGDVNAESHTGASGLGQMTGIAVKEVNRIYGTNYTREQMRTNPAANADASAKLFAYEMKVHKGNVEYALAAYNGGRTALKKANYDVSKMRPETAAYPTKVLKHLSPTERREDMAYGGDFLQKLMDSRRPGGSGISDTINENLDRRRKRRDERLQTMGGLRGMNNYQFRPQMGDKQDYNFLPNGGGQQSQAPNFQGEMETMGTMNNGGADLPPQDGNMYSPTGGNGFNLNNMLRRKRNEY